MHRDDDDYDDRPRRRKKKDNTLLIVLLAVGGVLALGCGGMGLLFVGGFVQGWREAGNADRAAPSQQKTMTRDEAKKLLIGKTKDEVIELLGRPDKTSEGVLGHWAYHGITFDPVSQKADNALWVYFGDDGRVNRLSF